MEEDVLVGLMEWAEASEPCSYACRRGADEIERLRRENVETFEALMFELKRAEADNARIRAALEPFCDPTAQYSVQNYLDARAALNGGRNE